VWDRWISNRSDSRLEFLEGGLWWWGWRRLGGPRAGGLPGKCWRRGKLRPLPGVGIELRTWRYLLRTSLHVWHLSNGMSRVRGGRLLMAWPLARVWLPGRVRNGKVKNAGRLPALRGGKCNAGEVASTKSTFRREPRCARFPIPLRGRDRFLGHRVRNRLVAHTVPRAFPRGRSRRGRV
jgi:hypothetical protein